MTGPLRRGLPALTERSPAVTNAGLELDRFLLKRDTATESFLIGRACGSPPPAIYRPAFEAREGLFRNQPNTASCRLKAVGRVAVGLGEKGVMEFGLTLHRLYGTPFIPGSALKGLLRRFVQAELPKGEDAAAGYRREDVLRVLLGDTGSASYLVFHDAWYVWDSAPGNRPLVRDVVTPHHQAYNANRGINTPGPWDFDDPVPNPWISATGAYLVAVTGPDAEWADWALRMLGIALAEWGVGGKTSSGYGRLRPLVARRRPLRPRWTGRARRLPLGRRMAVTPPVAAAIEASLRARLAGRRFWSAEAEADDHVDAGEGAAEPSSDEEDRTAAEPAAEGVPPQEESPPHQGSTPGVAAPGQPGEEPATDTGPPTGNGMAGEPTGGQAEGNQVVDSSATSSLPPSEPPKPPPPPPPPEKHPEVLKLLGRIQPLKGRQIPNQIGTYLTEIDKLPTDAHKAVVRRAILAKLAEHPDTEGWPDDPDRARGQWYEMKRWVEQYAAAAGAGGADEGPA